MPRRCRVCRQPYLGSGVCSDPTCPRNNQRQRDLAAAAAAFQQFQQPVSQSPWQGGGGDAAAAPVAEEPWLEPVDGPTLQQETAELRGLLHELLEISIRIRRRADVMALHQEVSVLERVVRTWGGRYIIWSADVRQAWEEARPAAGRASSSNSQQA